MLQARGVLAPTLTPRMIADVLLQVEKSFVRLVDSTAFEVEASLELEPFEMALSLETTKFAGDDQVGLGSRVCESRKGCWGGSQAGLFGRSTLLLAPRTCLRTRRRPAAVACWCSVWLAQAVRVTRS